MDSLRDLHVRHIDLHRDVRDLSAFLDGADVRRLLQIQEAIGEGDSIVLVAEVNGRVIGWAVSQLRFREELGWEPDMDAFYFVGGANAYLENLEVSEFFRGQGIGQELLTVTEAEVRRRGRTVLWLHTGEQNDRAQRFYARAGWIHDRTVYPAWRNGAPMRIYMKRLR